MKKRVPSRGWRACECGLVWRVFQPKPGAGRSEFSSNCHLQFSLAFLPSALNLNRLGLIYLFTLGRGSSLIGLLATPFTGGPRHKGFEPLEEGREKQCKEIIFSFRSLAGVKAALDPLRLLDA